MTARECESRFTSVQGRKQPSQVPVDDGARETGGETRPATARRHVWEIGRGNPECNLGCAFSSRLCKVRPRG